MMGSATLVPRCLDTPFSALLLRAVRGVHWWPGKVLLPNGREEHTPLSPETGHTRVLGTSPSPRARELAVWLQPTAPASLKQQRCKSPSTFPLSFPCSHHTHGGSVTIPALCLSFSLLLLTVLRVLHEHLWQTAPFFPAHPFSL